MLNKKRLLAIVISFMMIFTIAPATSFAATGGAADTNGSVATTQGISINEALVDYNTASVTEPSNGRIGQNGTTNIRQYFFHGADVENANEGVLSASYPYANTYGYKYTIMTNTEADGYWDNYIQEKQDSKAAMNFGFFLSGSQTAHGSDVAVNGNVLPNTSIRTEDGTVVLTGEQIFQQWKNANLGGSGGGSGGGPARGFDVLFSIPAGSLQPNTDYIINFEPGLGVSTKSDKKIVFHFTTQPIAVTSVALKTATKTLVAGKSTQLSAVVAPDDATDKAVTWSSSNTKITKVNSNGKTTALRSGKVEITAKTNDGSYTASTNIRVVGSPEKVITTSVKHWKSKVTWKRVAGATGYKIYRATKGGKYKAVKMIKSGSVNHWYNSKLKTGKTYYYKVKAFVKTNGKTSYTKYSRAAKVKIIPCTPKFKLSVKNGNVVVTKKEFVCQDGWQIAKLSRGNNFKIVRTLTHGNKYTSLFTFKGHTYKYKIRTYKNVNGKKVYSKWTNVKSIKM